MATVSNDFNLRATSTRNRVGVQVTDLDRDTGTATADNVSLKRITAGAGAGDFVRIFTKKSGGTQAWKSIDSGFDPNQLASYTIYTV
jgi:hypothetical protein